MAVASWDGKYPAHIPGTAWQQDGPGLFSQVGDCEEEAVSGGLRQDVARQILAQQVPCPEHPMPFPKPSCWACGRNGAFHRAALIALGEWKP